MYIKFEEIIERVFNEAVDTEVKKVVYGLIDEIIHIFEIGDTKRDIIYKLERLKETAYFKGVNHE